MLTAGFGSFKIDYITLTGHYKNKHPKSYFLYPINPISILNVIVLEYFSETTSSKCFCFGVPLLKREKYKVLFFIKYTTGKYQLIPL